VMARVSPWEKTAGAATHWAILSMPFFFSLSLCPFVFSHREYMQGTRRMQSLVMTLYSTKDMG
jgi:hypothetical protein